MEFIKKLWTFLRVRKKLWLAPIIIVMLIFGGLLLLALNSSHWVVVEGSILYFYAA